jgi:hypothetical protein
MNLPLSRMIIAALICTSIFLAAQPADAQRPPITILSNHSILESLMPSAPAPTAKPVIEAAARQTPGGVVINADLSSPSGSLDSATIYIADRNRTVLWTEHMVIRRKSVHINATWPRQETRITNGIYTVGPVLAVNTVGVPKEEAPYIAYSAPCLIETVDGKSNETMLAYFGTDGEFNELADMKGNIFYKSIELARVQEPGVTYGQYLNKSATLREGQAQLIFLNLNIDKGLTAYPPLVFVRSPLLHYGFRMEMAPAPTGGLILQIEVTDSGGQVAKLLSNIGG